MANDAVRNAPVRNTQVQPRTDATAADPKKITGGLETGARGPEVKELQRLLNEKGCKDAEGKPLKTDSVFGPRTEAAVKSFQTQNGIEATGVIDPPTLAKIQGTEPAAAEAPSTDAEPATEQPTPKASKETVESSRTKMRSREELMRARVEGADRAVAKGEKFDVINDSTVQAASEGIADIKGSIDEQKASILTARQGIRKDIFDLQSKKERTEPEDMLLTGKKAQEETLGLMDKHLDTKKEVMDAALGAVSDGIISEGENKGLADATNVLAESEKILALKAKAADQVVATAESLGAKVPGTAEKPVVEKPVVDAKPVVVANKPSVEPAVTAKTGPKRGLTKAEPEVKPEVKPDVKPEAEVFAKLSPRQVDDAVAEVKRSAATADVDGVFTTLEGMPPNQLAQVKDGFKAKGGDFDKDIRGRMWPSNQKALDALTSGKTEDYKKLRTEAAAVKTDVDALGTAINGMGTDEGAIFKTLKGASPERMKAIEADYQARNGESLRDALKGDLDGNDLARANAYLDGKPNLGSAILVNSLGTDNNLKTMRDVLTKEISADRRSAVGKEFKAKFGVSMESFVDASLRGPGGFNLTAMEKAQLLEAAKQYV